MSDLYSINEPTILSDELIESTETTIETSEIEVESSESLLDPVEQEIIYVNDDGLTNETFNNGIAHLVDTIDPYSVNEEVSYRGAATLFGGSLSLPDYAVTYEVNGYEVVFPTSYADDILVVDGLLINLGANYTAGVEMDGYSVNNYLSSEITIPTYHSATWYQYLQTYGQPYRIVDRYVNNYGSIASSTRDSVYVDWSGGNPWQGFTFDRIALFMILLFIAVMFIFRKGR